MPRFLYQARDNQGELATGVVAAVSLEAAGRNLRAEGKYVVHLKEVHEEENDPQVISVQEHARSIRRHDVIYFAHQMAVMLDTGVPIAEALECITEQSANPHFRALMAAINDHVSAGGELSVALRKYPRVFPPIMVSLIRASEVSGSMGAMLERISKYMEKEERTRRQVKGALTYPCIMIALALSVTVFLLTFVLPRFAAIYASRQAVLPGPTRVLLFLSSSLTEHWVLWLAGVATVGVALMLAWPLETTRRGVDWLKLHTPILGNLFMKLYLSRACRALGTMLAAGVSVLDAVEITRQVTPNRYFQELWDLADEALRQGMQLSDPLNRSRLIPRSVVQMMRSGEKAGRMSEVLHRLAGYTEEEFDQAVKNATQYIEPIMVMVMGALVGFIAISLLLPIFSISRVIAH